MGSLFYLHIYSIVERNQTTKGHQYETDQEIPKINHHSQHYCIAGITRIHHVFNTSDSYMDGNINYKWVLLHDLSFI